MNDIPPLEDYFEGGSRAISEPEGMDRVGEWRASFDVDDPESLMAERYADALDHIQALNAETTIWRCQSVPTEVDPGSVETLGRFWTTARGAAECYWHGEVPGVSWVFEAILNDVDNVDIVSTLDAWMLPAGAHEEELRLLPGSKVRLVSVEHEDRTGKRPADKLVEIEDPRKLKAKLLR